MHDVHPPTDSMGAANPEVRPIPELMYGCSQGVGQLTIWCGQ
jgi:hypothetical protein